jgi:hypothetical protein
MKKRGQLEGVRRGKVVHEIPMQMEMKPSEYARWSD